MGTLRRHAIYIYICVNEFFVRLSSGKKRISETFTSTPYSVRFENTVASIRPGRIPVRPVYETVGDWSPRASGAGRLVDVPEHTISRGSRYLPCRAKAPELVRKTLFFSPVTSI